MTFRSSNYLNSRSYSYVIAELTLAAHREQGHQQRRLQQVFRRDRGLAVAGVHPVEGGGQPRQGLNQSQGGMCIRVVPEIGLGIS